MSCCSSWSWCRTCSPHCPPLRLCRALARVPTAHHPISQVGPSDTAQAVGAVARIFGTMTPFLRVYSSYCAGCTRALQVAADMRSSGIAEAEAACGHRLDSLLIKPVRSDPTAYTTRVDSTREVATGGIGAPQAAGKMGAAKPWVLKFAHLRHGLSAQATAPSLRAGAAALQVSALLRGTSPGAPSSHPVAPHPSTSPSIPLLFHPPHARRSAPRRVGKECVCCC